MKAGPGETDGLAYADPAYARTLAEFGAPVRLPRSGGSLLQQRVPHCQGTDDLCGPYPLFSCTNWAALPDDLIELDGPVSLVLVSDPMTQPATAQLARSFPDRLTPFKAHGVTDLRRTRHLPQHHRRHLRRAARLLDVEVCADPLEHLDDWQLLYSALIERHRLTGVHRFSPEAFAGLFLLRNLLLVRAVLDGASVSMAVFLRSGDVAYYHLGASSAEGYAAGASYAVFSVALEHLKEEGVALVDLGSNAGYSAREDGLSRFKSGWADEQRTAFLCGRVLDHRRYAQLTAGSRSTLEWFPAYRTPPDSYALDASS